MYMFCNLVELLHWRLWSRTHPRTRTQSRGFVKISACLQSASRI